MFRYGVLKFRDQWTGSLKIVLAIAVLVPLFACGPKPSDLSDPAQPSVGQESPSDQPGKSPAPVEPTQTPNPIESPETGTLITEEKGKLQVYWLIPEETKLELKGNLLKLESPNQPPAEQIKLALERLVKGPANADVSSAIPNDTQVNQVEIKGDGIHLDLSKTFTEGGGSASMQGRLGQVIYTASSLDPNMSVWISIDGEPLTVLAGEGLEVAQPMTRKIFQESFSL